MPGQERSDDDDIKGLLYQFGYTTLIQARSEEAQALKREAS